MLTLFVRARHIFLFRTNPNDRSTSSLLQLRRYPWQVVPCAAVSAFSIFKILTQSTAVQSCMKRTATMMNDAAVHDSNPSTVVTDQVCLRRCMLHLQKLQLWLRGSSPSFSLHSDTLLLPCSWLQLEPVHLPLSQLRLMTECLFPPHIMSEISSPSEAALKFGSCYCGSKFERHLLLALLHPSITLPLDDFAKKHAPPPVEPSSSTFAPAAWHANSMFMHSMHCLRMAIRKFVQSFSSIGKPSCPQSSEVLMFIHELQVCFLAAILLTLGALYGVYQARTFFTHYRPNSCKQCYFSLVTARSRPKRFHCCYPSINLHPQTKSHQNVAQRCCLPLQLYERFCPSLILPVKLYGMIFSHASPLWHRMPLHSSPGLSATTRLLTHTPLWL